MAYCSETSKAKEIIGKYLKGKIIDIGSGGFPITEDAICVDGRNYGKVDVVTDNLYDLYRFGLLREADTVFSSHCLEHLANDTAAITEWSKLLKQDGFIILYLPDGKHYSNENNMEHMRDYNYDNFIFYFNRVFCGAGKNFKGKNLPAIFQLIDSGTDFREDCYSFFVVAKKL
tara:strand:+ start:5757 stop:6275 length:519 start_codon:yes stop_codon:yes gene_type:complete